MRIHRSGDPVLPALVLIHGLSSSHHAWQRNVATLGQSHHLLVVELFSRRSGARFRLREQADRLADALAADPAPMAVIGHSLGGLVAMELCSGSRHLVDRLVLVDVPGLPSTRPLPQRMRDFVRRGVRADPRSIGVVAQTLLAGNPVQLAAATAVSLRADASDLARRVEIPTLLVWGRDDPIVPLECGERLAAMMPNATLNIIEDAAHQPQWEAPDAFHAAVMPFLDGN